MTSPDFSEYIDLTINNKTIDEIYDEAVEYAQTSLPEFTPRVGTIENAILEAVAHSTGSLITVINSLPDGLMEGILRLMGFDRIEATPSQASILVELSINTGATIAAGTLFAYNIFDAEGVLTQFLYETNVDITIPNNSTTETITVTSPNASLFPDIPIGTALVLVSSTPFILNATLTVLSSLGTDTESDEEYFNRAVKFLASLSSSITTSSQLSNYISVNYPTVSRFKVYDLTQAKQNDILNAVLLSNVATLTTRYAHNFAVGNVVFISEMSNAIYNGTYTITAVPTLTTLSYARTNANIATASVNSGKVILSTGMLFATSDIGGQAIVSLCDSIGDPVSVAQKLIIKNDINSRVVAGLTVDMHDINTFLVGVSASITVEQNYSTADVGNAVKAVIENYLSITGWDFAESVSHQYLITLASRVIGVKYITAMDATLSVGTVFASDDTNNVTILQKGAIPVGTCSFTATS